jgi:hypothetical protein
MCRSDVSCKTPVSQMSCGTGSRIGKAMVGIVAGVLLGALSLGARGEQAFKGQITDSTCAGPTGHATMIKKGENSAQCDIACVKMGAKYVLFDPDTKTVYQLDDQKKPKAFAGRHVLIVGTLNKALGTIHVSEMTNALSPKVMQAKSVYIDCDNCVRTLAKAPKAAFEVLADWGRFATVPDRKKADLIFLFSANPYLGDYVTRDAPDARPVAIDFTYMNVIDPATGENLWGDSRRWGSFRVAGATKDLIGEFKKHLEESEPKSPNRSF